MAQALMQTMAFNIRSYVVSAFQIHQKPLQKIVWQMPKGFQKEVQVFLLMMTHQIHFNDVSMDHL